MSSRTFILFFVSDANWRAPHPSIRIVNGKIISPIIKKSREEGHHDEAVDFCLYDLLQSHSASSCLAIHKVAFSFYIIVLWTLSLTPKGLSGFFVSFCGIWGIHPCVNLHFNCHLKVQDPVEPKVLYHYFLYAILQSQTIPSIRRKENLPCSLIPQMH